MSISDLEKRDFAEKERKLKELKVFYLQTFMKTREALKANEKNILN
jgi:hypothetical protein